MTEDEVKALKVGDVVHSHLHERRAWTVEKTYISDSYPDYFRAYLRRDDGMLGVINAQNMMFFSKEAKA
jgi:hypothetical protein